MNIAQALKQKNRLAGQISLCQNRIQQANLYTDKSPQRYDVKALEGEMAQARLDLIELKTKIAKANVGIADKLVTLSELKAAVSFWNGMEYRTGPAEREENVMSHQGTWTVTKHFSSISTDDLVQKVKAIQNKIDELQDDIDNYNATTKI